MGGGYVKIDGSSVADPKVMKVVDRVVEFNPDLKDGAITYVESRPKCGGGSEVSFYKEGKYLSDFVKVTTAPDGKIISGHRESISPRAMSDVRMAHGSIAERFERSKQEAGIPLLALAALFIWAACRGSNLKLPGSDELPDGSPGDGGVTPPDLASPPDIGTPEDLSQSDGPNADDGPPPVDGGEDADRPVLKVPGFIEKGIDKNPIVTGDLVVKTDGSECTGDLRYSADFAGCMKLFDYDSKEIDNLKFAEALFANNPGALQIPLYEGALPVRIYNVGNEPRPDELMSSYQPGDSTAAYTKFSYVSGGAPSLTAIWGIDRCIQDYLGTDCKRVANFEISETYYSDPQNPGIREGYKFFITGMFGTSSPNEACHGNWQFDPGDVQNVCK